MGNKIRLHRQKAQKILGRRLKYGEVVHHMDQDPTNDENSNLCICTIGYHVWLHAKRYGGSWGVGRKAESKRYFDKNKDRIEKLFLMGFSVRHIAEEMKVSRNKIKPILKKLGLKRSKSEAEKIKWGVRNCEIPKIYTRKELLKIGRGLSGCVTQKEFNKLTGISFSTIYNHFGSYTRFCELCGLETRFSILRIKRQPVIL